MNCEKCGTDAPVRYYDVDGFAYYLCVTCAEGWDAVTERPSGGTPADAAERSLVQ